MRTPYETLFKDFQDFTRVYVNTAKGNKAIGNRTIPRVYLLPPGEIRVAHMNEGAGKMTASESGEFMHTGGWCFVHGNNAVEINLLECTEKEDFAWDNLEKATTTETESKVGRAAAALQTKTVRLLNRRR